MPALADASEVSTSMGMGTSSTDSEASDSMPDLVSVCDEPTTVRAVDFHTSLGHDIFIEGPSPAIQSVEVLHEAGIFHIPISNPYVCPRCCLVPRVIFPTLMGSQSSQ